VGCTVLFVFTGALSAVECTQLITFTSAISLLPTGIGTDSIGKNSGKNQTYWEFSTNVFLAYDFN
jgi:hypothetical protein